MELKMAKLKIYTPKQVAKPTKSAKLTPVQASNIRAKANRIVGK